ncbi:hypothetical protein GCM10022251_74280 [Phytohabitans flavus]|uniref:Uncharacterized protein n=1 Tax=Phytohabitans flavus TaxID=1076124 RepID=A0A6F8XL13_9ACTN|nr:hypothetical protein Pflav_009160 [Phytohabitans flavus]
MRRHIRIPPARASLGVLAAAADEPAAHEREQRCPCFDRLGVPVSVIALVVSAAAWLYPDRSKRGSSPAFMKGPG